MARRGPGTLYRRLASVRFLLSRDRAAVLRFLAARYPAGVSRRERLGLLRSFLHITNQVRGYHSQAELLAVAHEILLRAGQPGLTVVECGAAKGSSTAKLSLVTARAAGRLLVYDSFKGIPENTEVHQNLDGRRVVFRKGAFTGRLAQVQRTVAELGAPEVCTFVKGWFAETLPGLEGPVDVALLDVDLLSSTRECLRAIYPRLRPGGVVFTQDGHLQAIVALLGDPKFWRDEVGCPPPRIEGLGRDKLLKIPGPAA